MRRKACISSCKSVVSADKFSSEFKIFKQKFSKTTQYQICLKFGIALLEISVTRREIRCIPANWLKELIVVSSCTLKLIEYLYTG
jgi:hypothetical protein